MLFSYSVVWANAAGESYARFAKACQFLVNDVGMVFFFALATEEVVEPYSRRIPATPFKAWDLQTTVDYMPSQFVTFRAEFTHRAANVPYFSGPGGVTPPGSNVGPLGSVVPGRAPDLRRSENRMTFALLVKL